MATYTVDPLSRRLVQTYSGLYAYQHVAVSHTGDLVETTFASFTIPGGTLGANGTLKINALVTCNSNANSKTVRVYFGGQQIGILTMTTLGGLVFERRLVNKNSESAQVIYAAQLSTSFGNTSATYSEYTVDTTQDQTLTITGQLAVGTDNITCRSVDVEVLR